jgi:hypothetical protein
LNLRPLGYEPYDMVCAVSGSPGRRVDLGRPTARSLPIAFYVSPVSGAPLHPVRRSVHKSGSGSRMGVGEGERPDMIAVQEGGGTRAS